LDNDIYIERDGRPILIENQKLRNTSFGSIRDKQGNCTVFGCVILSGPKTLALRARLSALQQRMTYQQFCEATTGANTAHSGAANHTESTSNVSEIYAPSLVSVSDIDADTKILRFMLGSEEEAYQLLHEVLRPLSEQLVGYRAYADRLCGLEERGFEGWHESVAEGTGQFSRSHPVSQLRRYDAST
jgi:hypothetical protein